MKTYLFRYQYRGGAYALEIPAESLDEAWERIGAIRAYGAGYDGELVMKIPAVTGSWLPSLIVRLRNWVRG